MFADIGVMELMVLISTRHIIYDDSKPHGKYIVLAIMLAHHNRLL